MNISPRTFSKYLLLTTVISTMQLSGFCQDDAFSNADASMIEVKHEYDIEEARFEPEYAFRAAFSKDCKMMAYANYDNESTRNAYLVILDLSTRKVLYKFHISGLPQAIAWSPDGSKIMMAIYNKLNHLDIASGKIVVLPVEDGFIDGLYWKKDRQLLIEGTGTGLLNLDELTISSPEYSKRDEVYKSERQTPLDHPKCKIVPAGNVLRIANLDDSYSHVLQKRDFGISSVRASPNMKYVAFCYNKIILLELGLRKKPVTQFSVLLKNYKELDNELKKYWRNPGYISGPKINPLNNTYVGGDKNIKGKAKVTGFVNDSVINIEVIEELSPINKWDVFTYNNIWGILGEAKQVSQELINKNDIDKNSQSQTGKSEAGNADKTTSNNVSPGTGSNLSKNETAGNEILKTLSDGTQAKEYVQGKTEVTYKGDNYKAITNAIFLFTSKDQSSKYTNQVIKHFKDLISSSITATAAGLENLNLKSLFKVELDFEVTRLLSSNAEISTRVIVSLDGKQLSDESFQRNTSLTMMSTDPQLVLESAIRNCEKKLVKILGNYIKIQ